MHEAHYRHLTYRERCHIMALKSTGVSIRKIANTLVRSVSTISRELKRNEQEEGYDCDNAADRYKNLKKASGERVKILTPWLKGKIIFDLMLDWSPDQITGRLKEAYGISVSITTIYRLISKEREDGNDLRKHLRHQGKKYNKTKGKAAGRGLIPNRVDIDERPKIVEEKSRFGDFEVDTIIGCHHRGAIVSIVDRCTKFTHLRLVSTTKADFVTQEICSALREVSQRQLVKTITSDNGKEFAQHQEISKETGADFYFAKPYHSWERGLNEHTNGLVRQYLPHIFTHKSKKSF